LVILLDIKTLPLLFDGLVGQRSCILPILFRLRVFNLPDQPLHSIPGTLDIEFGLCSPVVVEIDLEGEGAVLAEYEVVDEVVGIQQVLSDFLVALLRVFDHSNGEAEALSGVVADRHEVKLRVFKRVRLCIAQLHGNWFCAFIFLRSWINIGIPLNGVKV
jgi:hypothetical protein